MAEPIASFSGLATGIDTAALIESLVEIERIPIDKLEEKKSDIQSIQRRLADIASELKATNTILEKFNSSYEVLRSSASVSDDTKVEATVISIPSLAKHTMTVTALAKSEVTISDGKVSATTAGLVGVGNLSISVGGATGVTISITAGDSLVDVADKINSATDLAIASVIYDGTDYHLQVLSRDTGATDGAMTFTETGTVSLNTDEAGNQLVAAQNARFTINGHQMTRESNDVTEAIMGLSLELKATTASEITIDVGRDNTNLTTNVTEFVSKYNFMIELIDKEFDYTGEARIGDSLSGDSTLRNLQDALSRLIITPNDDLDSTVYNRLSALGIEITNTGTLEFDSAVLDAAIEEDPDAVVQFFAGDSSLGIDGFTQLFDDLTESYTRSTDGILTIRTDGIDDQVEDIDEQIAKLEVRLDDYEARLRTEFASLETLVSGLQSQGQQMLAALGQLG